MPRVRARFLGLLPRGDAEVAEELEVPTGAAVGDAVEAMARRLSMRIGQGVSASEILERHLVMLNGVSLDPEKLLTTELTEGDNVTIFLPVSGG